ncbi:hypothetical protein YYE_02674 [Plasmodium vinckei vinckei]|nr:hypothetical protein YYE_02674 [Plasmodium vinckei vinckei]
MEKSNEKINNFKIIQKQQNNENIEKYQNIMNSAYIKFIWCFCELHKKAQDHVCSKLKYSDLKKVILCEYCNAVIPDEEEEINWHLLYKCTYVKKTNKPKICDREKCKTVKNKIDTYKLYKSMGQIKNIFI